MVLPAPGRLSMMIGWPSCLLSCSNTMRAVMSLALPAANGMMAVIGRDGQEDCAEEGEELKNRAGIAARNTVLRRIFHSSALLLLSSRAEFCHVAPTIVTRTARPRGCTKAQKCWYYRHYRDPPSATLGHWLA